MDVGRIAFFGDIVGVPGRRAFAAGVKTVKERFGPLVVIANAENVRNGSGLHPEGYRELRDAGADALTLGDHCYKDTRIMPYLEDPKEPIARPANLAAGARGKSRVRLPLTPAGPHLYVVTVLGRLFMSIPANDPFAAVDRMVEQIAHEDESALVLVEIHAEATSEKGAMAWHCLKRWPRRVIAVLGTHTHVQTADARLLQHSLAVMSDVGFCGGHDGVIGRTAESVLHVMTTQNPASMDVCDAEVRADGCVITLDLGSRRADRIDPFQI